MQVSLFVGEISRMDAYVHITIHRFEILRKIKHLRNVTTFIHVRT